MIALLLPVLLLLATGGDGEAAPGLRNADFGDWSDGAPDGWTISTGATSAGSGISAVEKGPEGGLLLRGDASTGTWQVVAQEAALEPGATYRLVLDLRATGLRREGRQFDNCWAGVVLLDAAGKVADRRIVPVGDRPWTGEEIVFRAGATGRVAVQVFLSKSGTLEARSLSLARLDPKESFEVLVRHMGRYYSHFAGKRVDPDAWAAKHREKPLGMGRGLPTKDWIDALRSMLAELRDTHIWIRTPDGKTIPTHFHIPPRNFDLAAVRAALVGPRSLGTTALVGSCGEGLGYLALLRMPSSAEEFAPVMEALDGMLDGRGILLDLRANAGGDERRGLELAGAFCEERVVYATTRVRSGPRPEDLTEPVPRVLSPRAGRRFKGPVVVLTGPGCVSSGEGLAQMMAALPRATLVGLPTAGASGNPAPVDLPNGVSVWFSRWVDELPDGTPLEGRGVPPDRKVPHAGPGDPTFKEALATLRSLLPEEGAPAK